MSQSINLRELTRKISESNFFSIMIDEATDKSNKEQVVFVLRWPGEFNISG